MNLSIYFFRIARMYALACVLVCLPVIVPVAKAQSLRIVPPSFDTVLVGRTATSAFLLINVTRQYMVVSEIRLSSSANQSPFSVNAPLEFTIAPGDTIFLLMRCAPRSVGVWTDTINVRLRGAAPIQLSAPFSAVSRLQRIEDIFIRPGLRIIPVCAAPGDTVRLELYLSEGDTESLFRANWPVFRSTISFNANVLFPLNHVATRNPFPFSRRSIDLESTWSGRSVVLYAASLLVMNGDTDRTNVEISTFTWGNGIGPNVSIEPPLNTSFCVNVCTEGGKRLFRVVRTKNALLANVAPNPTSDNIEIRYTLFEPEAPQFMLLDAQGRIVQSQKQALQAEGDHILTLGTQGMASGAYRLLMRTASGVEQRTLAIVR